MKIANSTLYNHLYRSNLTREPGELTRTYLNELDALIVNLAKQSKTSVQSIVCGAQGAFPSLVISRLKFLGLYGKLKHVLRVYNKNERENSAPEPHPLDFEWYFTPSCAREIATLFGHHNRGQVICLSTPTVSMALSSLRKQSLLVDNNSLLLKRLNSHSNRVDLLLFDLTKPLYLRKTFSTVLFDAPWYLDYTLLWLWHASKFVSRGGTILFPLFHQLVRPDANWERAKILERADSLGKVEVLEGFVKYETPLFEHEALKACGVKINYNWRTADLILVHVKKPVTKDEFPVLKLSPKYDTFVIDQQVIKLRRYIRKSQKFIIAPICDSHDFILPTVSRRYPNRHLIDFWTSRNRVAKIGDGAVMRTVLKEMSLGMNIDNVVDLQVLKRFSLRERRSLKESMKQILCFVSRR